MQTKNEELGACRRTIQGMVQSLSVFFQFLQIYSYQSSVIQE